MVIIRDKMQKDCDNMIHNILGGDGTRGLKIGSEIGKRIGGAIGEAVGGEAGRKVGEKVGDIVGGAGGVIVDK